MRKISKTFFQALIMVTFVFIGAILLPLTKGSVRAQETPTIDDSFSNADGNYRSVTYKDGYWCFEAGVGGVDAFYVLPTRVTELLTEGTNLRLESRPSGDDDIVYQACISSGKIVGLTLGIPLGDEDFEIVIPAKQSIDFDFTGNDSLCVGTGQYVITCSDETPVHRLTSAGLLKVTVNGDIKNLDLSSGASDSVITVNGNVERVAFYGKECMDMSGYYGTLIVSGRASGVEFCKKTFEHQILGEIGFNLDSYIFTDETGTVLQNGELACQYEDKDIALSEDMFNYEYDISENSGLGVFEPITIYQIHVSGKEEYGLGDCFAGQQVGPGTSICPGFLPSMIPDESVISVSGTGYLADQKLVLDGNYRKISIQAGNVVINGSCDEVWMNGEWYQPTTFVTPAISVEINGRVKGIYAMGYCHLANISLGENGNVVEGQRVPIKGETRFFYNISGKQEVMSKGELKIFTYDENKSMSMLAPSDSLISDSVEEEYATLEIRTLGKESLSEQEKTALDAIIETKDYEILQAEELSVVSYHLDEVGKIDEESFQNISELNQEVEFTFSLAQDDKKTNSEDNTEVNTGATTETINIGEKTEITTGENADTDTAYMVVRLHKEGEEIQAEDLVAEDTPESLKFRTDKFSKYLVVKKTVSKEDSGKNNEPAKESKAEDPNSSIVTKRFADVKAGVWYVEAIQYVLDNGIMSGIKGTENFAPEGECTRAMMVTILYRSYGSPDVSGYKPASELFSDVRAGAWYEAPITWAYHEGVTTGTVNPAKTENGIGVFGTEDGVTREQLATFLMRFAAKKGFDATTGRDKNLADGTFEDADQISGFAQQAMSWANYNGIIGGKNIDGKKYLAARSGATRAEVAKMIMSFQKRFGK